MGKEYSKETIAEFFTENKFDKKLFTKKIPKKQDLLNKYKFSTKIDYKTNLYSCFNGEVLKTKKKISIKKIKRDKEGKGEILFKKEILLLEYLDHPNILAIYEYFQTKNYYYIVYDYFEGKNLLDSKKLKEEKLKKMMFEFCRGLFYMHSKNIAHRNLDPELIKWNGKKIMISHFQDVFFQKKKKIKQKKKILKK